MDKEMELLLSEKEVKVGDKKVIVKRIALLDTIRLASHLSGVVGTVVNHSELFGSALAKITYAGATDEEGNVTDSPENINNIRMMGIIEAFGVVGEDGTDLLKDLIVKATNLSDDEVEDIDCTSGIDLLFEIYEVNKGFFEKCMSKLKEKLTKKKKSTKKEK